MKLKSQLIPSGNATALEIPKSAVDRMNTGPRPPVVVSVNGHSWRTRIALMRGLCLVGVSAANRAAAGIAEGETVEFTLELDDAPREVDEPADLKAALDAEPALRAAFARLAFGLRQKEVRALLEAKTEATRERRLAKLLAGLRTSAAA